MQDRQPGARLRVEPVRRDPRKLIGCRLGPILPVDVDERVDRRGVLRLPPQPRGSVEHAGETCANALHPPGAETRERSRGSEVGVHAELHAWHGPRREPLRQTIKFKVVGARFVLLHRHPRPQPGNGYYLYHRARNYPKL